MDKPIVINDGQASTIDKIADCDMLPHMWFRFHLKAHFNITADKNLEQPRTTSMTSTL